VIFRRRHRWERADRINDFRVCPGCACLVWGDPGQMQHTDVCAELSPPEDPGYIDPGGYIIPDQFGNLPVEVRGGEDSENERPRR
jgi:hypothetical protein